MLWESKAVADIIHGRIARFHDEDVEYEDDEEESAEDEAETSLGCTLATCGAGRFMTNREGGIGSMGQLPSICPPPASFKKPACSQAQGIRHASLEDICHFERRPKKLGQGSYGSVFKRSWKQGGKPVAVKIIEKITLERRMIPFDTVATECEMMHQCIGKECFVQLYDVFETPRQFCLVLEFCNGGNVEEGAISVQAALGEAQVRLLIQQMLDAVVYLHSISICHRDVKPHNYFLMGNITRPNVKVKLGDFGISERMPKGRLLTRKVGTPAFMAPEIHLLPKKSRGYDLKVDVWALGVSMIFLLASEYPFMDGQGKLLRERIVQGGVPLWEEASFGKALASLENLSFGKGFQEATAGAAMKRPSRLARDLTRRLLIPSTRDRLSSSAALKHEWFSKPIAEGGIDNLSELDPTQSHAGFWGNVVDALSGVHGSESMEQQNVCLSPEHPQVGICTTRRVQEAAGDDCTLSL